MRLDVVRLKLENGIGTGRGFIDSPGGEQVAARGQLAGDVLRKKVGGPDEFFEGVPAVAHFFVSVSELGSRVAELGIRFDGVAVFDDRFSQFGRTQNADRPPPRTVSHRHSKDRMRPAAARHPP